MKTILILFLFFFASTSVTAEEWTEQAITLGVGRIEIVSDYLLFSSSKSYNVVIPKVVRVGTRIPISYEKEGKNINAFFDVAAITTKGALCRFRSHNPSKYEQKASDTIYVKPCEYKLKP